MSVDPDQLPSPANFEEARQQWLTLADTDGAHVVRVIFDAWQEAGGSKRLGDDDVSNRKEIGKRRNTYAFLSSLGASSPTHRLTGRLELDKPEADKLLKSMLSQWTTGQNKTQRSPIASTDAISSFVQEITAVIFKDRFRVRVTAQNQSLPFSGLLAQWAESKAIILFCERKALRGPNFSTAITTYAATVLDEVLTTLRGKVVYVLDFGNNRYLSNELDSADPSSSAPSLRTHEAYKSLVSVQGGLQRFLTDPNPNRESMKNIHERIWFVVKNLPRITDDQDISTDIQSVRDEFGMPDLLPKDIPVRWKEQIKWETSNEFPQTVVAVLDDIGTSSVTKLYTFPDESDLKQVAIDHILIEEPGELEEAARLIMAAVDERCDINPSKSDLTYSKYLKLLGYELLDIREFMTIWDRSPRKKHL